MLKSLAKGPLFGALGGAVLALLGYLAPLVGGKSLDKYSSDFTYLTFAGAGIGALMIVLSMILGRRSSDHDDDEEITSPWATAKDELEHLGNLMAGEDTPALSKKEQKEQKKKDKETEKFNKQAEKEAAKAAKKGSKGRKKGKGEELDILEDEEPVTFTGFPSMRKNVDPSAFTSTPSGFPDASKGFVGNPSDFPGVPAATPASDFPSALGESTNVAPAFAPALFDPESEPDWLKDAFEDGSLAYPYGDNNAPKTIPLPGETEIREVEVSKNSAGNLGAEHDEDSLHSSDKTDEASTDGSHDSTTGEEKSDGSSPKIVQNFFLPNGDLDLDSLEALGDVSSWNTDKKDGAGTGTSEELSDKDAGHSFPGGVSTSHSDDDHSGEGATDTGTVKDSEGNIHTGKIVNADGQEISNEGFMPGLDSEGNAKTGTVKDSEGNVHTGIVLDSEANTGVSGNGYSGLGINDTSSGNTGVGNSPTKVEGNLHSGTIIDEEGSIHSGTVVDANGNDLPNPSFETELDAHGNVVSKGSVRDAEGNVHSGEVLSSEVNSGASAKAGSDSSSGDSQKNAGASSGMNAGTVRDSEGSLHSGVPVDDAGNVDGGASFGTGFDADGNANSGTIRDAEGNLHSGTVVAPVGSAPVGSAPVGSAPQPGWYPEGSGLGGGNGFGNENKNVGSVREADGTVHSGETVGAEGSLPVGTVKDGEGNTYSGLIVDENGNIPSDPSFAGEASSSFEAGVDEAGNAKTGSIRDAEGNLHSGVVMGSEGSVRTGTVRDESGIFRSGVVLDAAGNELKVNSVYPQRSANGSDDFEIIDNKGESKDSKLADTFSSESGEVFTPTSAELEEAHRISMGAGIKTVGDFVVVEGAAGTAKVSDKDIGTGSDDIASLDFDKLTPPPYRHEEEKSEELFDIPAKEKDGITVVLDRESFGIDAEGNVAGVVEGNPAARPALTSGSDLDVLSHDIQEIVKRVIEETRIGQRKADTAKLEEENARLIQEVLDKETKLSEQLAEQERLQAEKDLQTAKDLEDKDAEIARLRAANKKMSDTLGELEGINQDLQSAQNTVASMSARSERIKISHKINQFKESLIEESADPKSIVVLDVLIDDLGTN